MASKFNSVIVKQVRITLSAKEITAALLAFTGGKNGTEQSVEFDGDEAIVCFTRTPRAKADK